ncbi:MarR family winged helix-turn-helix transcriptional regulator [Sulfurimonas sp. CS5]|jgi:MarR family transcriptional regulator for hemolysin
MMEQVSTFGSTATLGLLIARVKRKMRKRMNDKLKPYGITAEQRAILLALCEKGDMTQVQLCDLISVEPSNLSTTLKRLEKKSYIEKVEHPTDPRAYLVKATQQTQAIAHELLQLSSIVDSALFKDISDEELSITFETLKKMDRNF